MLSLLMQEATSAPFFWGNMGAAVAMILASASPFSWRCRALPCLSPRRRRGLIWPKLASFVCTASAARKVRALGRGWGAATACAAACPHPRRRSRRLPPRLLTSQLGGCTTAS